MKKIKQALLFLIITLSSFKIYSQNYNWITFTPTSISVTGESGSKIFATVRANCYGSQNYGTSISVNPIIIPNSGYRAYTFQSGTNSSILHPGEFVNIVFEFQRTVTSTSTTNYRFSGNYRNPDITGGKTINISVTYDNSCNLNPPANRFVSDITDKSARLNWSSVTNAFTYQYQYKKNTSSSWWTSNPNNGNTSNNISSLEPNTNYNWRVRTRCMNRAYGNWSPIESFTTLEECQENIGIYDTVNYGETDVVEVSNNITSYGIIESGANIEYSAGNQIVLAHTTIGYSFKAETGSTFRAYIEGCTATSSKTIIKSKKVKNAVEDIEMEKLLIDKEPIRIYPNPTNGIFKISSSETIVNYTVINQFNRVVLNNKAMSSVVEVDIQNLPKSIYFIKVVLNNGNTITKKIIKN